MSSPRAASSSVLVAEDARAVSRFKVVDGWGQGENIPCAAPCEVGCWEMGTNTGVGLSIWVFAWNRRGSVYHDKIHDFAHAASFY